MRIHTFQTVHDLIQSRWEPDTADKAIDALRSSDGKPITTRLAAKLEGIGGQSWRLRREYGMTALVSSDYDRGKFDTGIKLFLCHSEGSIPLDLTAVIKGNSAYFSARVERNHARMEAMNTRATLDAIAAAMNAAERAIEAIVVAQAVVAELTQYGTTLNPDSYAIEKACGLDDADGRPILNREYKTREPEPVEA